VTTLDREGAEPAFRGATMSSFQPMSLEPPLVSLVLERGGRIEHWITGSGVFAVSILDRAHEFQSDRFSGYGPLPDARFTGIAHDVAVTGSPVLHGALAWFDCEVADTVETGDHVLVIGAVRAAGLGPDTDDPLLNYEGGYRRLEGA
jgi:flavin reductase (DIM6/NTAB) family NADH-FMN oxidoreductase RutF